MWKDGIVYPATVSSIGFDYEEAMRPETQHAYHNATNYIERLMIALWVHDGWDQLWPWTMIPKWLAPRYDWRQLECIDSQVETYDATRN